MKLIDKLMNILAALALTFAALATIPAAAYGAVTYHGNMHEGFVIDNTVSQEAANMEAERICEITAPATNTCHTGIIKLENECVAFGSALSLGGQMFAREGDTIAEADAKIGLLSGLGATNDNRSVCDHTCTDGQSPNADDVAGCHTTTADDCSGATPILDETGTNPVCRAATDDDECRTMVNAATPIHDNTDAAAIANGNCRAATDDDECRTMVNAATPIHDDMDATAMDNGNCRAATDDDECRTMVNVATPIHDDMDATAMDNGNCRAATDDDECRTMVNAATPIHDDMDATAMDNGNCRAATDDDECRTMVNAATPIHDDMDATAMDNGNCRAATDDDECRTMVNVATPIHDDTDDDAIANCRAATDNDECRTMVNAATPIHDNTDAAAIANGNCRAATDNDECRTMVNAATPFHDNTDAAAIANGNCRAADTCGTADDGSVPDGEGNCMDCDSITEQESNDTCICIPESHNDFVETGTCVENAMCDANQIFIRENSDCMDCDANEMRNEVNQCSCPSDGFEISPNSGNCVAVCPADMPVRNAQDICEVQTLSCPDNNKVPDSTQENCVCPSGQQQFDGDNTDCRDPGNSNECEMVNSETPIFDSMLDGGNGECRAALSCDGTTDGIPDADGGCMSCGNRQDVGTSCGGCINGFEIFNGNCVAECPVDMPDRNNDGVCQARMDDGDGETPEFVFELDEETGSGETTTDRYVVAATAITNLEIAISTTLGGITYTSEENSSEQLRVSPSSGVVSFINPDSVAAGDYQIFIAATQGGRIIATLSLYFTIAAADDAVAATSGGGSNDLQAATAGAAGAAVFIASYFIAHYVGVLIDWTPSYAFRNHNGDFYYAVGSRWTAAADNWRWYWQANQSGGNRGGQFGYGSGMSYHGDIFAAAFNSQSDTKQTAMDLSLSANKTAGVWHFGGGYRFNVELTETETETKNRLNITARYTLDKWILSATANTDGNKAAARINYSYRF